MRKTNYWFATIGAMVIGLGLASSVRADTITVTGSGLSGTIPLSAKAVFTLSGSTLTVALTNTSSVVVPSNTYLLTGVFWDSSNSPGGTFTSITIPAGSVVVPDGSDSNIGYFAYGTNSNGTGGRDYGAFSSGYANVDTQILGPGASDPPNSPDGPGGGLISQAGLSGSTVNKAVINDTVLWTITGVSPTFQLSNFSNFAFQYGTDLSEPSIPGTPQVLVPVPQAAWLGIVLVGGIVGARKLRARRDAALA